MSESTPHYLFLTYRQIIEIYDAGRLQGGNEVRECEAMGEYKEDTFEDLKTILMARIVPGSEAAEKWWATFLAEAVG